MDIKVQADGSIPTVAVIGIIDNALVSYSSFPDTEEGNQKAQELFKKKIKKAYGRGSNSLDLDMFIEDGIFENSDISILLTHNDK